ncbi:MAG: alpha/beta hydrolase [Chitinophagaceae bacterium]|nr:MAG: alpha/beta hydrolase [Chitinophagaceae bacterium]
MSYTVKQDGKFKFIEEGEGDPIIMLHGLFGAMSNFSGVIAHFSKTHKVIVPLLPLFELDLLHTTVGGLEKFFHKFIIHRGYQHIHLMGNSLGGHVALVHVIKNTDRIKSLILTGSSGLFENGMGDTYPKRGDYDYIRKKTEMTFYDPNTATKELVDEVYQIVNERMKVIKVISLARSAIKNNLSDELKHIKLPTLLIWGNNDCITPPFVGREFNRLIPQSELHFIDHCGHAPMMEVPSEFNIILEQFLRKLTHPAANS